MNLFRKMPHQNIGLRTFFLTQVNTVDLSPIENYNFGWGPNFVESPSSLVYMLYDLQQTITCCSDEPKKIFRKMPHQNIGLRTFFLTQVNTVDLSHNEIIILDGPKLCRVTIFFGLHVVRLATDNYLLFGWTSSARCLTRTLDSVRSFSLRSTL